MKLALTLAAGMLAASSFAFAADNNGNGGKGGGNNGDKTGSITDTDTDRFDPPDQSTVEACKTAPATDANCKNALSR